jgi:cytochrome c oxidase cbb3-type subunit 3
MISWKASIKPSDIQKVASYVVSLQGSKPATPKPTEPEAKQWVEKDAKNPATADTTKVAAKVVVLK